MKPESSSRADEPPRGASPRRPYSKPRLQVYGDLAQMTKGVVGTKTNDGSGHPNRHFTS
jgi:hypothetical protein